MYTAMLVDDEFLILRIMKENIDWNRLGFGDVYTARNGNEAIEIIEQHKVDLVITDIRMPIMDGIQLIETVYDIDRGIKFIIMTGYDEFKYAQKAIAYDVKDYLLKPVQLNELEKAITRIRDMIQEKENMDLFLNKAENQLHASLPYLRENVIYDWLYGRIQSESVLMDWLNYLNIKLDSVQYRVVVIRLETEKHFSHEEMRWHHEQHNIFVARFAVANLVRELLEGELDFIAPEFTKEYWPIIVKCNSEGSNLNHRLFEELQFKVKNILKMNIFLSYGYCIKKPLSIQESFVEATRMLGFRLFFSDKVILSSEISERAQPLPYRWQAVQKEILDGIKLRNLETVHNAIDSLFALVEKEIFDPDELYAALDRLLLLTSITIVEMGEKEAIYENRPDVLFELKQKDTLKQIQEWFHDLYLKVMEMLSYRSRSLQDMYVKRMIDYMKVHYNEELTLEKIAFQLGLSPNYCSSLIKSTLKKGFAEYLTELRIDQARYLLANTDLKVFEIADKVGYRNIYYFSKLFKQTTGVTPTQYRGL
ncbi:response regulator [Paenibacillus sp. JSM ZJ436]|uniref:response regulator n=1 Tax=Paenibacillus sp. JSM ZJ436 TaxID=3376190 RepID=UPI003794DEB8